MSWKYRTGDRVMVWDFRFPFKDVSRSLGTIVDHVSSSVLTVRIDGDGLRRQFLCRDVHPTTTTQVIMELRDG